MHHAKFGSHQPERANGKSLGSAEEICRTREPGLNYWHLRALLAAHGFRVVRAYPIGVWLVRAKWLQSSKLLESRRAQRLEGLTRWKFLTPFAPDMVLVARKDAVNNG